MPGSGRVRDARSDALLLRAASVDPAAFSELYARHVEAVYAWLRRRMEWAGSDLTAETFARAWLTCDRFRDERDGAPLPWLRGRARSGGSACLFRRRNLSVDLPPSLSKFEGELEQAI